MTKFVITLALGLAPAALLAQVSTSTEARAGAGLTTKPAAANAGVAARAQTSSDIALPSDFSTAARAQVEATFQDARSKQLPEQPMRDRMAEAIRSGTSEAKVVAELRLLEARLDASQHAMVRGGHASTTDAEIVAGARAMEHGVAAAQLTAVARRGAPDRDLTASFDALTTLVGRGVPVTRAVAEVRAKLDAGASDDAIRALAANADVGASAGAAVNGAVRGIGGSVGGSVTGAVGGVLGKRP